MSSFSHLCTFLYPKLLKSCVSTNRDAFINNFYKNLILQPMSVTSTASAGSSNKKIHTMSETIRNDDPLEIFGKWFTEAKENPEVKQHNAIHLATVKPNGMPAARMVILRGYSSDGFTFFTNYNSPKAHDLKNNPNAAIVMHWEKLKKTVRIEGCVEKISSELSDKSFSRAPVPNQIYMHVSKFQSDPIPNSDDLARRWKEVEERYKSNETVPRPEYWGGYIIKPDYIEFLERNIENPLLDNLMIFSKQKPSDEKWLCQKN